MSTDPMTSYGLKKAKREVRRRVLEARDAIPPAERDRLAAEVTRRFLALPEVEGAGTVMGFWTFGSELTTTPLIGALHAAGARVALPRIVEGDIEPVTYTPGDPTTETAFGAMEPAGGEVLAPTDIDVVATPAVVFDRRGARVGYGGGFYDRFFAKVRPDTARIGIGFGVQLLPEGESLPGGHFDLPVDAVVTESEVVRCSRDR
jgi:5-formyltetrahydrofolate cyclo-ligase